MSDGIPTDSPSKAEPSLNSIDSYEGVPVDDEVEHETDLVIPPLWKNERILENPKIVDGGRLLPSDLPVEVEIDVW